MFFFLRLKRQWGGGLKNQRQGFLVFWRGGKKKKKNPFIFFKTFHKQGGRALGFLNKKKTWGNLLTKHLLNDIFFFFPEKKKKRRTLSKNLKLKIYWGIFFFVKTKGPILLGPQPPAWGAFHRKKGFFKIR